MTNSVWSLYCKTAPVCETSRFGVGVVYKEGSSLKKATCERRGTGQRRQVTMSMRIPTDWKGFLRNDENKNELFLLLASYVVSMDIPCDKELYTTAGESVLSSKNRMDLTSLAPCTHEKADTHLMVHVLDASLCGHRRIMIRTNDTDAVVLAASIVNTIPAEDMNCGLHMVQGNTCRTLHR